MGRIKPKVIKRSAEKLLESDIEFSHSFSENKQAIKGIMPSKRMRNMVAGYISRLKRMRDEERKKLGLDDLEQ